ncbi:hypothetical protein H8B09_23220 [Paenibacillus sp. PR3]|uniref:Chromo domain-containing protein n=1 Tax=Paenibacillus terricola TaxID=2763503 RepID=A0ABR8N352_9BACL|nr:hypothetical protein [Paenibacillus terricola]MBD3921696.1 hypothetical protein [Paenibacillus terricola]
MNEFQVGKMYNAIEYEQESSFTVLEKRKAVMYVVKWTDDEDETLAEPSIVEKWTEQWRLRNGSANDDENTLTVGKEYHGIKAGVESKFELLEKRDLVQYRIKWDYSDQEVLTEPSLMKKWTNAWKEKHGLENWESEGDTRRNVKVQAQVKESLELLKSQFKFRTESDVIQALLELYKETDYYPKKFINCLLELRR